MPTKLQLQLATLQQVLASQHIPQSQDEVFQLTANALCEVFGQLRILFYLIEPLPTIDPFDLIPCPARQLAPNLFIFKAARHGSQFHFETERPHCVPIKAASRTLGLIYLERIGQPLTEAEQTVAALSATQAAHHLIHLDRMDNNHIGRTDKGSILFRIDTANHRWFSNGTNLLLKGKQLAVLQVLLEHRGYTYSRALLERHVYPTEEDCGERLDRLDMVIFRLRRKLSHSPVSIETVRGKGYRLEITS